MERSYILAIDQGTTGTRAALVDRNAAIVRDAYVPLRQILPGPGLVEHDPLEIWQGVTQAMEAAVGGQWDSVAAIGITNQRETTVLWDRATSKPVHNAIVWQDRRTAPRCDELRGHSDLVQDRTGLVVDAYFSATKLQWLLEHVPNAAAGAREGRLASGTIDSWLVWNLTAGRAHLTDFTNASRTMLYHIHDRQWDEQLLDMFQVPRQVLPEVRGTCEVVAHTAASVTGGRSIPIAGIAGDQQAALFGQRAWNAGQAKNTYGTGAFLLMNVGQCPVRSEHRLLLTLACDAMGRPAYALEGSIFIAGAAIQWLRDELQIIASAEESETLAASLPDNGGVYFVPALVGLGAPQWRPDVRGAIFGLSRGSGRAHLARAALEAMAFQSRQVIEAMQKDSGVELTELATDGGATRNNWLMQFQADVLDKPVVRASNVEMTAIGAALLAGLATGFWQAADSMPSAGATRFVPQDAPSATTTYDMWCTFLKRLL